MRKLASLLIAAALALTVIFLPGVSPFVARPVFAQSAAGEREGTPPPGVSAQDAADFGEAAVPITALRGMKHKTLVFVFDVSGSMRDAGNLRRARAATVNILRQGAAPGDHVALLTFGASYNKVFDTTLQSRADLSDLIGKIPSATEAGAGTNIRKPHHEALKMVDADDPNPGVIVLLTDSFNDEPKPEDPAYAGYLKYYTHGGHLTKYPKTPENRDYERLLGKLLRSGRLTQYGIGIKIADNGRPVERLPQAAPPPVEAPPSSDAAATTHTIAPPPAGNSQLYIWLLVGAGVIVVAVLAMRPMMAAVSLRISGGPAGQKDFSIRSGQTIRLGGDGASVAFDAYALPGTKEPVALVRGTRGQLVLSPPGVVAGKPAAAPAMVTGTAPGNPGASGSNPEARSRVFHNGLPFEKEVPLRYGDEVRVSLVSESGGAVKDYRLRFEDPRKSY